MQNINMPTPKSTKKYTVYDNLAGVDFSQSAENVAKNRSPLLLNMVSDNGRHPVKRAGWEIVVSLESPVHNIWHTYINRQEYFLAHAGSKIYKITENDGVFSATVLKGNVNNGKGCGFFFRKGEKDGFYILTGGEYLVFDGQEVKDVMEDAYVPTTVIARSPAGGGESYEDINFLTGKRCEKFTGDDTKIYQLSESEIESVEKVESLNGEGEVDVLTAGTDYTVDLKLGKVTFTASHKTPVDGQDNIYITYTKTVEGYKDRIVNCSVFAHYGVGGNNRVFLSGNPKYMAYDFWSNIYDPTYFPDLKYSIIGSANTAVMGYHKVAGYLAIVKERTQQDTTVFLRSGSLDSDGEVVWEVKPGIVGIGAVSKHSFIVLNDDPLFLSDRGIYSITNSSITYERTLQNRSYNVDAKLTEEKGLENAVAVEHNGLYILAVNDVCYVLDGKKTISGRVSSSFNYECYYWDNVPARCFSSWNSILWFGDGAGNICRFKDYMTSMEKYNDNGQPIRAVWTTPYDDDGMIHRFKTVVRKGCLVVLAPFTASSCKVYYCVDGSHEKYITNGTIDISDWFENINFERFTFVSNDNPREIYFNKRQRKYKRLMLMFVNDEKNEGFGIHKIVKTYKVNGYSKNRG